MPTLNVDVLAIVCEFLTDSADLLSFALTCSSLRPVAAKCLLSVHPIHLRLSRGDYTRKFLSFLFADAHAPSRTPHVHVLKLSLDRDVSQHALPGSIAEQQDDSPLLINILTSCPHIEHIKLFLSDGYSAHNDNSRLIDTIAAIPSLRSLSVYASIREAVTVLRTVRAPLRMAGIHCRNIPEGFWYPAALQNTLNLPRLATTLTNLELGMFAVDRHANGSLSDAHSASIFSMTQYPAVRSLSIDTFIRQPRLDHLQHLFPALDGTLSVGGIDPWLPRDSYADIRATNQRAQRSAPSCAWKKLDRVVVRHASMLYALGLLCPVRLLVLDVVFVDVTQLFHAKEALRENPVPRLKLSLLLVPRFRTMFVELLSPELADTLTHLTICFLYSNGNGPRTLREAEIFALFRWDTLLEGMVSAFQPLRRLTHLRIVVHATIFHDGTWTPSHSEGFVRSVRGSAFEATAAALVPPLPSLQFLALTTSGCLARQHPGEHGGRTPWKAYEQWNITRAYRVAQQPGPASKSNVIQGRDSEPVLVSLHDEVTETIMRKEELELSETDKTFMSSLLVRQYL